MQSESTGRCVAGAAKLKELEIWLNFLSGLAESLAWPLFAIIALLLLRAPLIELSKRFKNLKVGDTELSFKHEVGEFLAIGAELGITQQIRGSESFQDWDSDKFRGAVLEKWLIIESLIRSMSGLQSGSSNKKLVSVISLLSQLLDERVIDEHLYKMVSEFRDIRNKIVHTFDVELTDEEKRATIGSSQSIIERLEQANLLSKKNH